MLTHRSARDRPPPAGRSVSPGSATAGSLKTKLGKDTNFPFPKENSGLPTGQVLVFSSLLLFVNKQTKKPKEKAGVIFQTGISLRPGRTCWDGRGPPGHAAGPPLLTWNWGAQVPSQPLHRRPSALRLPQKEKSSSASADSGSERDKHTQDGHLVSGTAEFPSRRSSC